MLSKKSINAINATVWLGFLQSKGPVSLQKISGHLNLSISCLEQIFAGLKAAKLIQAFKGPGGGYFITCKLKEITLWNVAEIFEQALTDKSHQTQKESSMAMSICQEDLFSDFHRVSQCFLAEMTLHKAIEICMSGQTSVNHHSLESHNRFKLKPMSQAKTPSGPNSIFNWSAMQY
ncbi:MAG: Rrf2 family transcriptional regulator [Betaproteobacteria bacterium]